MLNWNGMVIKIPRKEIATYSDVELDTPGIYFLFCKEENQKESVYVGEAENILKRLKQHIQDYNITKETYYWQVAICIKGKDLNKTLIRYLENFYCTNIRNYSKYELLTKKSFDKTTLKRAEKAAMSEFIDNVNMLMGTIGYKSYDDTQINHLLVQDNITYFYCTANNSNAKAYLSSEGFVVTKNSKIAKESKSNTFKTGKYKELLDSLIEKHIIENYIFVKDYTFTSPSAAANIVMQSNVSGNKQWKDIDGKELKDYNI